MKKMIYKLISYVLTLTLLCGFIAVFVPRTRQQAKALCEDYVIGTDNTIYYFYDDCPTLTRTYFENGFSDESYAFIYDRQNNRSLTTLVNGGYFSGFGENCVVVIDIKNYFTETNILYNLFCSLKQQGCITVFVTGLNNINPAVPETTCEYIDVYYQSDGSRLLDFVSHVLTRFESYNTTESVDCEELYSETTIFIDDEFVYINNPLYIDLGELYQNSSVLRTIVNRVIDTYEISPSTNLTELGSTLSAVGIDLKIIVHVSQDVYVDILSDTIYDRSDLGDERFFELTVSLYNCALAWNSTDAYYYDFLQDLQYSGQIYVFEADPIQYSPDGISCYTDSYLISLYGEQTTDTIDLLEQIQQQMNMRHWI